MVDAPRSIGRPLDEESARTRAAQIRAVADPFRLRVLSAMAADPEGTNTTEAIAKAVEGSETAVTAALRELSDAGLVGQSETEAITLTADAWVRFGRLLTVPEWSSGTGSSDAVGEAPFAGGTLPPVVERITDELSYRFSAQFSRETVARYVAESYSLLAERAKITKFLPSLTSRFATDRLAALGTAQGNTLHGTPEVLFVCVQNAGRSQMAAAILRFLAGDRVHVRTAGSAPAAAVHPTVVEALDEIGVPLAAEFPKPLTDEVVRAADYVITMGCGDACPIYPGRRYMDWVLDDPVGKSLDEVRAMRDDIYERVRELLDGMAVSR